MTHKLDLRDLTEYVRRSRQKAKDLPETAKFIRDAVKGELRKYLKDGYTEQEIKEKI